MKWQMYHTAWGVVLHSQNASSQPMTLVCNNGGEEAVWLCETTLGVGVRGWLRGQAAAEYRSITALWVGSRFDGHP